MRFGYRLVNLGAGQQAHVATPEKALLDMVHLQSGADQASYLEQLRLDYHVLDLPRIEEFARASASPKLLRAARRIAELARAAPEYAPL